MAANAEQTNLMIVNQSRNTTLITHGRVAANPLTRLRGLIGVRKLPAGDGLLIDPCKGVHCMFMSIAIDVLYVNAEDRVIAVDQEMQPWRVGRVHRKCKYVVELPAGTVARTGTQTGDQLVVTR